MLEFIYSYTQKKREKTKTKISAIYTNFTHDNFKNKNNDKGSSENQKKWNLTIFMATNKIKIYVYGNKTQNIHN